MGGDTNRLYLGYDGLRFEITSPSSSHLKWVDEFLRPHFTNGFAGGEAVKVELIVDPEEHEKRRRAMSPLSTVPVFVLDSQVVHLPASRDGMGGYILYAENFDAVFTVSADRHCVRIILREDGHTARSPLMKILREYAMNDAQQRGDFFLHASCFLGAHRPVVVTGPKNAGKTTLVMFACLRGGAKLLANDRVRVSSENGRPSIRGVPAIVSIREGSFEFFPEVGEELCRRQYHFRLNLDETFQEARPPLRLGGKGRYLVTPLQFCRLLKTVQVPAAEEPIVVIPQITQRRGTCSARRLSGGEAFEALQESLFGARHWATSTPVFNLRAGRGVDEALLRRRCEEFAARNPFIACDIGQDFYGTEGAFRSWSDSLNRKTAGRR